VVWVGVWGGKRGAAGNMVAKMMMKHSVPAPCENPLVRARNMGPPFCSDVLCEKRSRLMRRMDLANQVRD
jgi:hypothetical protein